MPLFEPLRLNPDFIAHDREFLINAARRGAEGAGSIDDPELRRRAFVIAASNFRRAGAHSLLLGEFDFAREMFGRSAGAYYDAAFPYGVMMEVLTGRNWQHFDGVPPFTRRDERPGALQHQRVYSLLAAVSRQGPMRDRALAAAREFSQPRSIPLGVLGIPLGDFVDLASALATGEGVRQAVVPFLQTYNRAFERAWANSHKWAHLGMTFHPAEPDIISVLHCVRGSESIPVDDLLGAEALNDNTRIVVNELLREF